MLLPIAAALAFTPFVTEVTPLQAVAILVVTVLAVATHNVLVRLSLLFRSVSRQVVVQQGFSTHSSLSHASVDVRVWLLKLYPCFKATWRFNLGVGIIFSWTLLEINEVSNKKWN